MSTTDRPIFLLQFIFVFHCVEYDGMEYANQVYPKWAEGVGWFIVALVLSLIPIGMVTQCYRKAGSWKVRDKCGKSALITCIENVYKS